MELFANTLSPFVRIARIALAAKGFDLKPTLVDQWADDENLRKANIAARIPTLVLDDGTPITETLLIVQWLEHTRPSPQWPSLLGESSTQLPGVLSRSGIAIGALEASVHTIIMRRFTSDGFDETTLGLRRRRTMAESLERLEVIADQLAPVRGNLRIDQICALTLYDYQKLRYGDKSWLPVTPRLADVAKELNQLSPVVGTAPFYPT